MKKYIILPIFLLSIICRSQTLQLDTKQSVISWTGKAAVGNYSLSGTVLPLRGEITMERDSIRKGELVVNMKSISSDIARLTKHLKSADFFEVKKYPEAIFSLLSVQKIVDTIKIDGSMKIKSTSHKEVLSLQGTKEKEGFRLKGKINIDRTRYGIYFNSNSFFQNLGSQAIADNFTLDVDLFFRS